MAHPEKITILRNQFVAFDYIGVLHKDTLSPKRKYQKSYIFIRKNKYLILIKIKNED